MNKYNFDQAIDRKSLHSHKWDVEEGVLPLSIADTDFCSPKEVREAILEITNKPAFGYTFPSEEYYEAYIKWWNTRYGVKLKRENFMFSTSIVGSIDSILKRISKEGDKVALFSPNYNVFYNCILNNKRVVAEIPFKYENYEYSIDWDLFELVIKESKVFILCNPHNPIGIKFNKNELSRIIQICKKYNVYIISDEIHCDIDYNLEKYDSILSVAHYDKTILCLSPGKIFNLAGLHSSIVYIEEKELRELIQKGLYEDDIGEPSIFSIDPVTAAYKYGNDYVYEMNEYIKENRRIIDEFFRKNGINIKIISKNYTYLLWLDISSYSQDSDKFASDLLKESKVKVVSGNAYHQHFSSFVRVNIATQRNNIIEFCNRLKSFLK